MKIRENRTEKVWMRITPKLKEQAQEAADRRGVALSRWLEIAIKEMLRREGKKREEGA